MESMGRLSADACTTKSKHLPLLPRTPHLVDTPLLLVNGVLPSLLIVCQCVESDPWHFARTVRCGCRCDGVAAVKQNGQEWTR